MYVELKKLDLAKYIKPGDTICWGQGQGEPLCITGKLHEQHANLGDVSVFVGIDASGTPMLGWGNNIRFISFCGTGSNRKLVDADRMEILPIHYSALNIKLKEMVDVLMVQVAEHPDGGRFCLSMNCDYLAGLMKSAKVVIAEVNEEAPFTIASEVYTEKNFSALVRSKRVIKEPEARAPGKVNEMIASHVAGLVSDNATIQLGIGTLPDSIASALRSHKNLGIHSGILSDGAIDLVRDGIVTNSAKKSDCGKTITGSYLGSRRMMDFIHLNEDMIMVPISRTHSVSEMAQLPQFTAINSALEVDLTGQLNTEIASNSYVGTIGGAVDFHRGAMASDGGVAITAFPSTYGKPDNLKSRIVADLSGPVSIAKSDTGVVVTEFGIADLRGLSISRRKSALAKIAHPTFRDELLAASAH